MLVLSHPCDQARLNAAVHEILHLKMTGCVCVPGGEWDCSSTLGYLERRLKLPFIATQAMDGSTFIVMDKIVRFTDEGVLIESYLNVDNELCCSAWD